MNSSIYKALTFLYHYWCAVQVKSCICKPLCLQERPWKLESPPKSCCVWDWVLEPLSWYHNLFSQYLRWDGKQSYKNNPCLNRCFSICGMQQQIYEEQSSSLADFWKSSRWECCTTEQCPDSCPQLPKMEHTNVSCCTSARSTTKSNNEDCSISERSSR